MSKKIAIFVEGLTEEIFTIRLIQELAGGRNIHFEIQRQHRGKLNFIELLSVSDGEPEIYILVANCSTDGQLKTLINDRYKNLVEEGYSQIIGIRDVHPLKHDEIQILRDELSTGLVRGNVSVELHLAVMEVEAWFLEELTHFSQIDAAITEQHIINGGFDYPNVRAEQLINPAKVLTKIYKSVNQVYKKNKYSIMRTVHSLDYEELVVNTVNKSPSLSAYVSSINNCI